MSFIPQPCTSGCCPDIISGFCLADGTPIGLVVFGDQTIGWINFVTGIYTPGPPPAGIVQCLTDVIIGQIILGPVVGITGTVDIRALDCNTDSITVCPPVTGLTNLLDCATDSITVCPPVTGLTNLLDCTTDSVTVCPPATGLTNFLDCTTDSVTVCPPATGVTNLLDCTTDSVTICVNEAIPVTGTIADTEEQILCDVDACGVTLATVLVVRTYDANGNPSPPKYYDLLTGDPYVIQGTLQVCDQRVQICDPITVCPGSAPIPVEVLLDANTDSVAVVALDGALNVSVTGTVEVTNPPSGVLDVAVTNGPISVVSGRRSLLGMYYGTFQQNYASSADPTTGGDLWLLNTSNTVVLYLREVRFAVNIQDLALLTNLPVIRMERMTFTGTPSSAIITPAKRDSIDAANTGTLRTGSSGIVVSPGNAIRSFAPASSDVIGGLLSANAGTAVPAQQVFAPIDIDGFIAIRQNEGVVFRQHTAGSSPENRVYWLNINWEEI